MKRVGTSIQYSVTDFLTWQRNGLLELSPSFQRRQVWSPSAKSFFIDTIAKGLPNPIIFIREITDLKTLQPKRQVVDGQQRLRTVLSYIDPKCLKDYQKSRDYFQVTKVHNDELGEKDFEKLPSEIKEQILGYPFTTHVLPTGTDDKQILQIFARLNATGVKLNSQELRNSTYFGDFKQIAYKLSYEQLARWRKLGIFTEENIARMDEVELTSDLILLILKGIATKSKWSLDNLYRIYEKRFPKKSVIQNRFRNVMDSIDQLLGSVFKDSAFSHKTLFYYIFALVYDFQYRLGSSLVDSRPKNVPHKFISFFEHINNLFVKGKAPKELLNLATRRSSSEVRKKIYAYLKSEFACV
jgi:hypothetical protein